MIDVENDVFTFVANRLFEAHPGVTVSGEYEDTIASLPTVTIEERDNSVLEYMRTTHIENAVLVMYECAVYSNKTPTAKSEAKRIATTADEAFAELGFTRTFRNQIPNYLDKSIHRIVARYEAVIGPMDDGTFLVYQN